MRLSVFATTLEFQLGGIARSVPRMAMALAEAGMEVTLLGPTPAESTLGQDLPEGLKLRLGRDASTLRALLREEMAQLQASHGILYHAGVWSHWNHLCSRMARQHGVPYIVSPRSMLDPWALRHRGLKKKLAWRAYAQRDYKSAAAVHVTSELEAANVRAVGIETPQILVPHGVDLPPPGLPQQPKGARRRLLFLSRLHPKKGLADLIKVFASSAPDDWDLIVAGNDESNYGKKLQEEVARRGLSDQIDFCGPVEDKAKWALYASADCFVLPSYSENFGLVVAEALISGVPVVTTSATPWAEVRKHGCGWYCDPGANSLQQVLNEVYATPREELQQMGERGKTWMEDEFAWAKRAEELKRSLLSLF
jgi:glycosyltransferase involved in cell wall biosynthesis